MNVPHKFTAAITTCPRPGGVSYLRSTVESVRRAGFEPFVSVQANAAEFATIADEAAGAETILHCGRRGAWNNFLDAARHILATSGPNGRALICEDDIELTAGLREFLDTAGIPSTGVSSLYTAAPNDIELYAREAGVELPTCWYTVGRMPHMALGALAYLMRVDTLKAIVSAAEEKPMTTQYTDHNVGLLCRQLRLPYRVHTPSFAVHRGQVSSLPAAGIDEYRQCRRWASEYRGLENGYPVFSWHFVSPSGERLPGPPGAPADRRNG